MDGHDMIGLAPRQRSLNRRSHSPENAFSRLMALASCPLAAHGSLAHHWQEG